VSDLVERLRDVALGQMPNGGHERLNYWQAADEIERLTRQCADRAAIIDAVREAMRAVVSDNERLRDLLGRARDYLEGLELADEIDEAMRATERGNEVQS
jgi:hypothetical protein